MPVGVMWFILILFLTSHLAEMLVELERKRTASPALLRPKSHNGLREMFCRESGRRS